MSAERRARRRAILRAARRADRDRRLRRDLLRFLSSAPIREWLDGYAMPGLPGYWGPAPEPRERLTVTTLATPVTAPAPRCAEPWDSAWLKDMVVALS